jgi:tetratricopeptide (TPR) repeat protein
MSAHENIESLQSKLARLPASEHPEARARTLAALAMQFAHAGLPMDGLDAVKETLTLASAHQLHQARAEALAAAAMCHRSRSDFLMAIACGIDAYQGFVAANDNTAMGHVLTTLAATCRDLNAFDLGEEVLQACLVVATRTGDRFLEARTRNALGLTLAEMGQFVEAEQQLRAACDLLPVAGATQHLSTSIGNLGTLCRRRAEAAMRAGESAQVIDCYREAITHLREALRAAVQRENKFDIADRTLCLGQLHFALGEPEEAHHFCETALSMAYELKHTRLMVESDILMSRIEIERASWEAAEQRLRKAIEKSRYSEQRLLQQQAHAQLAELYKLRNVHADAEAQLNLAEEIRLALATANGDAEREIRAMWHAYFRHHPLLENAPLRQAVGGSRAP